MNFKKIFPKSVFKVLGVFILLLGAAIFILALSFDKELISPLSESRSDFTMIVLPDTQLYSRDYPEIFEKQTQWIVDQKEAKNIAFVTHLGDITQSWNKKTEWENANRAMSLLDKQVPYGLLPGNHDDPKLFNQYFPVERYQSKAWWGGHYGKDNSNSYQLFSAGEMDFIILHLEINPPQKILDWADEQLKEHGNRRAIISTHYLLDFDGFRSPQGQEVYKSLADNPNLFLILSGHIHFESKRTDKINDQLIHQLLANYQTRPKGGNGWLRILKFVPKENKIYVQTYSPFLDQFETDENSQFELDYQMEVN